MIRISPIDYFSSNYRMVRKNKKITPVSDVGKVSNNRSNNDSNPSSFGRNLEQEIQKQKKIKKETL